MMHPTMTIDVKAILTPKAAEGAIPADSRLGGQCFFESVCDILQLHSQTRDSLSTPDLDKPETEHLTSKQGANLGKLTISVLRRFVPRKQSAKLPDLLSVFSILSTCFMYAT
jgi:hypothetical protein